MKGTVGVGYRLFNEIFYGKKIHMAKANDNPQQLKFEKKKQPKLNVINDYSSLLNKCSEFLYRPIEAVEALGMRKQNFNKVMSDPQAKKLKKEIAKSYKN